MCIFTRFNVVAALARLALALAGLLSLTGAASALSTSSMDDVCRWPEGLQPVVQGAETTEELTIDGYLDEGMWARAMPATGFVQYEPDPGAPASQQTDVYVLYDSEALYIGARLHDEEAEKIVARLARRNQEVFSDWFYVGLDSYNDNRTAFAFGVNARGVQRDLLLYDDTEADDSWEAVWQAATHVDSTGWTAELRIPFSQLRFSDSSQSGLEPSWGVTFQREIARLDEVATWSGLRPDTGRRVSCFGRLTGLQNIASPSNLELLPYGVSRFTQAPGDQANPFYSPNDLFASLGGDLKYQLSSNLTLNATVNPDFGQVEADPSEVNLSAFETFYSERRPFFTEGADIFRFRITPDDGSGEQLFYSRRIGQSPSHAPSAGDGYVDVPEVTRILGASKISGQSGPWTIGALNAVTEPTSARVASDDGDQHTIAVEPLTNYGVGRLRRSFDGGQSSLGGIITATNRFNLDGHLRFLSASAYAGGVDFRHRFANNTYEASGYLLGSHVTGSEEAIERLQRAPTRYYQRPDASHVTFDSTRTTLSGYSAGLNLQKTSGALRGGLLTMARTPGFEINDLGFQQHADMLLAVGYANYTAYQPAPFLRQVRVNVNLVPVWTFDGTLTQVNRNLNLSAEFSNMWSGNIGGWRGGGSLSPFELRGGPAIRTSPRTMLWASVNSDQRKPIFANLSSDVSFTEETGGHSLTLSPRLTARPAPHIELSLQPSLSTNDNPWQYVETARSGEATYYVFGRLRQTEAALTLRLGYTFSPTLSLELYAQPFLSAGEYSEFREVTDPRAERFEDRSRRFSPEELIEEEDHYGVDRSGSGQADFSFRNPDFNVREFNTNAVLRWEYRPGSTLYVVWQQRRQGFQPDGHFALGRDLDELFASPATNTLMVKLNYWFDL